MWFTITILHYCILVIWEKNTRFHWHYYYSIWFLYDETYQIWTGRSFFFNQNRRTPNPFNRDMSSKAPDITSIFDWSMNTLPKYLVFGYTFSIPMIPVDFGFCIGSSVFFCVHIFYLGVAFVSNFVVVEFFWGVGGWQQ